MQLVGENDAAAFAIVYERHADAAFSLAFRMCGKRAARRRRGAGGVPLAVAQRLRATTACAAACARGCSASCTTARSTRCAAACVQDRGRVSDEGIEEHLEAAERTDQEVGRRDEAREIRAGARGAARRAEPRDRARLLRRLHAFARSPRCSTRRWERSRAVCVWGFRRCARNCDQGRWSREFARARPRGRAGDALRTLP